MPSFSATLGNDPFTLVHQAIWDNLNSYAPFAAFFRAGAQINVVPAGTAAARPPPTSPGNTPEIRIMQSSYGQPRINSGAVFLMEIFSVQISTSNLSVQQSNLGKFLTLIAVAKMPNNLGGLGFVTDFRPATSGLETVIDPDTKLKQWESVIAFQCTFRLSNDDLVNL